MTHDPMCPFKDFTDMRFLRDDGREECWGCDLVAVIKADALDRAIKALEALTRHDSGQGFNGEAVYLEDVVTAINALRGES